MNNKRKLSEIEEIELSIKNYEMYIHITTYFKGVLNWYLYMEHYIMDRHHVMKILLNSMKFFELKKEFKIYNELAEGFRFVLQHQKFVNQYDHSSEILLN